MSNFYKFLASICAATSVLLFSSNLAFALGTPANTTISNTATLAYDVNGVRQTNITSPSASFVVDNKVDLIVNETSGSPTLVTPGQLRAVTIFTVTNNGNAVQDYALTGGNVLGAPVVFGTAENFNALACNTFAETNGTAGYQVGADTATFIDELAPDASLDVYIVCDIPAAQSSNDQAVTQLTAVTRVGGAAGLGAVITQTVGVGNPAAVDIVFADPATAANGSGTIPTQTQRDATGFARDAYRVATVAAIVTKTATCSPAAPLPNTCSQAKTGTIITYQIKVDVTGSGTATALVTTDPLPIDVTYVPATLNVSPAPVSASVAAGTATIDLGNVAVTPATPKTFIITLKASIN
jgi:uncharacterized repeat protein (TIGR01451 family)